MNFLARNVTTEPAADWPLLCDVMAEMASDLLSACDVMTEPATDWLPVDTYPRTPAYANSQQISTTYM
jgi:hypothetical protein